MREVTAQSDIYSSVLPSEVKRNPTWTRDELILALDLYFRHPPGRISDTHPEVVALSAFLNSLPIHDRSVYGAKFRNPSGVYMKLGNFSRVDPTYTGKGLSRGNKLEVVVWDDFADDRPKLASAVAAIRRHVLAPEQTQALAVAVDDEDDAPEGRLLMRVHRSHERSSTLRARKKALALATTGALRCEVCELDFSERYGARGEGYIECHHTVPVSQLRPGHRTKLDELALVCANCHRIIHRGSLITVADLRVLVKQQLGLGIQVTHSGKAETDLVAAVVS